MKKKIAIIILALIILISIIPERQYLEDGGSVCYKALLYEVTKLHQLDEVEDDDRVKPYLEGYEVKILGITVYRNTWNESIDDTQ